MSDNAAPAASSNEGRNIQDDLIFSSGVGDTDTQPEEAALPQTTQAAAKQAGGALPAHGPVAPAAASLATSPLSIMALACAAMRRELLLGQATTVEAAQPATALTEAAPPTAGPPAAPVAAALAASPAPASAPPDAPAAPAAAAPESPTGEDLEDEDDEQMSSKRNRPSRARYMRFYRSVDGTSKKTPKEVLEKAAKMRGKRGALTCIYEDWLQAKEDWAETCMMQRLCRSRKESCKGTWRWTSKQELEQRYGDPQLVTELIGRKARKHATNVRWCAAH